MTKERTLAGQQRCWGWNEDCTLEYSYLAIANTWKQHSKNDTHMMYWKLMLKGPWNPKLGWQTTKKTLTGCVVSSWSKPFHGAMYRELVWEFPTNKAKFAMHPPHPNSILWSFVYHNSDSIAQSQRCIIIIYTNEFIIENVMEWANRPHCFKRNFLYRDSCSRCREEFSLARVCLPCNAVRQSLLSCPWTVSYCGVGPRMSCPFNIPRVLKQ